FFSVRRRHTRFSRDWSSDVCSSDLHQRAGSAGTYLKILGTHKAGVHIGQREGGIPAIIPQGEALIFLLYPVNQILQMLSGIVELDRRSAVWGQRRSTRARSIWQDIT